MEKKVQGKFVDILKNTLAELPEGKIEFLGPTDGKVSVAFVEGDILMIESTWGTGNDELQKVYEWKTGTCIIKGLTPEEKRTLETSWQKPVILDQIKKDTQAAISTQPPEKVYAVFRDLKREALDLHALVAEIHEHKYSGELRVTTPQGHNSILFYQGLPLTMPGRMNITREQVIELMDNAGATLNFYVLGEELAHAMVSVYQGEKVWNGLSVTVFHLDKMLNKLMEKKPTGHLCIHKEQGGKNYCFFFQGVPLGVYDIDKHWTPVEIAAMWEDAKHVDYYLSGRIEPLVSTASALRSVEDLKQFIPLWNNLVEGIAKKLGKKPVEKSMQKNFGDLAFFIPEGTALQAVGMTDSNAPEALEVFKKRAPAFLREMETIVGRHWLEEQFEGFRKKNSAMLERLSLIDLFAQKGG
ncbi:MAG: hypothetical protein JXA50_08075 [Deltaproteobacteria bacterium]|nr:hypothetical protein [Deltaproteobacteria bacterium]